MIEESKYCIDMMKKHFSKETVMKKESNEDLKNSTKCWICDNGYIDTDDKVRDNCHIIVKNVNIKISVIPNGLEKYMSFTNKFIFVDSFQFLSSSLDGLFINLNQDDFKYLSQEFD